MTRTFSPWLLQLLSVKASRPFMRKQMTREERDALADNGEVTLPYKARCHRDAIMLLTIVGRQRDNDYAPARRTTFYWLKRARDCRLDAEAMGWRLHND